MKVTEPQVQLRAVGVDIPEQPEGEDSAALALTLDMLEMPAEELERRFRDVWGNNADEIRFENITYPRRAACFCWCCQVASRGEVVVGYLGSFDL